MRKDQAELLDRFERAAMAYERLGKLTKDDEKTRTIRKDAIAELAAARNALLTSRPETDQAEAPKADQTDDVAALIAEGVDRSRFIMEGPSYVLRLNERLARALERLAKERDEADGWRIRYGEVVAKHAELEAALAKAQADIAEYQRRSELNPLAGMSWNGFNIWGDEKSIKEVRRIEHRSAQLEQYSAAFDQEVKRLKDELAKAQAAVPVMRKALEGVRRHFVEVLGVAENSIIVEYIDEGLNAAPPTPSDGLLKVLENVDKAITSARNYIPDDDEGVASDIFAYYLNAAQMEVRAALAEQEKAK